MYACMDAFCIMRVSTCVCVCVCVCVILLYMRQTLHLLQTCRAQGAGSWGIHSSSFSSPFHFVLCHSWCLAQRGHDPYPHGSFHLVLGMPFRRSGIHGTKNFISFVVFITITTFIIFTISSSCSTRLGQNCTGNAAIQAVLPWSSLMRAHGFRRNMPARRRSCVSRSGNQVG